MHPTRILLALCICCCACKKKDDPKPAPIPRPNADIVGLWFVDRTVVHSIDAATGNETRPPRLAVAVGGWNFQEATCLRNTGTPESGPYTREGNVIIRQWGGKMYRDTITRIEADTLVFRTTSKWIGDPIGVKRHTYAYYYRYRR